MNKRQFITRFAAAWRRWRCEHPTRLTGHRVDDRCIITETFCRDCGKMVPAFDFQRPAIDQEVRRLLYENFG